MATYLYCVLAPPRIDAAPGLPGIGGTPVRAIVTPSGLEAWVSTIDEGAVRTSGRALAEQALLHNEVADAALATGRTPLPARFGSQFADDATCIAHLEQHHRALSAALTRVADAVEMSVLLVPVERGRANPRTSPRRDEPAAGRRYLEAVRQRTRDEERRRAVAASMAGRITSTVASIVRGESRDAGTADILSVAHLVGRGEVDRYRREVTAVVPEAGYRIVVAGPRAPYSFAAESAPLVGHDSSSPNRDE